MLTQQGAVFHHRPMQFQKRIGNYLTSTQQPTNPKEQQWQISRVWRENRVAVCKAMPL